MKAARVPRPTLGALFRLYLIYGWRHHRLLRLTRPKRWSEWVQWRKMFDHDPRHPLLQDKLRVKDHVAELLGPDWVIPTLWQGDALPETPPWPGPFVVKARHGCNQTRFVRDAAVDWPAIRRVAARWMTRRYGFWLDEWLYRDIPRGLIVEPFIGEQGALPVDWKIYIFAGQPVAVQVHRDREAAHSWALFTPDWHRLTAPDGLPDPPPPPSLPRMLAAAALLGEDFDFIRADFYEVEGAPKFGEITFYPGSGLDRFHPDDIDLWLGSLWRAARDRRDPPTVGADDWLDRAAQREGVLDQR